GSTTDIKTEQDIPILEHYDKKGNLIEISAATVVDGVKQEAKFVKAKKAGPITHVIASTGEKGKGKIVSRKFKAKVDVAKITQTDVQEGYSVGTDKTLELAGEKNVPVLEHYNKEDKLIEISAATVVGGVRTIAVISGYTMDPETNTPVFTNCTLSIRKGYRSENYKGVNFAKHLDPAKLEIYSTTEPLVIQPIAVKTVLSALIELLKEKDPAMRSRAAEALGNIGPDAKTAIPALTVLLKDKDDAVRTHGAEALKKIDPEKARQILEEEKKQQAPAPKAGEEGAMQVLPQVTPDEAIAAGGYRVVIRPFSEEVSAPADKSKDDEAARKAAEAAKRKQGLARVRKLMEDLNSKDAAMRNKAAGALALPENIKLLTDALKDAKDGGKALTINGKPALIERRSADSGVDKIFAIDEDTGKTTARISDYAIDPVTKAPDLTRCTLRIKIAGYTEYKFKGMDISSGEISTQGKRPYSVFLRHKTEAGDSDIDGKPLIAEHPVIGMDRDGTPQEDKLKTLSLNAVFSEDEKDPAKRGETYARVYDDEVEIVVNDKPEDLDAVSRVYERKDNPDDGIISYDKNKQTALGIRLPAEDIDPEVKKALDALNESREKKIYAIGVYDIEVIAEDQRDLNRLKEKPAAEPFREIDSLGRMHIERKKLLEPFVSKEGTPVLVATSKTRNFFENPKMGKLITKSETVFVRLFGDKVISSRPLTVSILHTEDKKPTGTPVKKTVNGKECYEYFVKKFQPDIADYGSGRFAAGSYIALYDPTDTSGLPVKVEMRDPSQPPPDDYRTIIFSKGWNTFKLENREFGMTMHRNRFLRRKTKFGYARFKMNLGQVFGYANTAMAPLGIQPLDASGYSYIRLHLKGKSVSQDDKVIAPRFRIGLSDIFHVSDEAQSEIDCDDRGIAWSSDDRTISDTEWRQISIPLNLFEGVDISRLGQLFINFGDDIGNQAGHMIFISRSMLLTKAPDDADGLPLELVSGRITVGGDVEFMPRYEDRSGNAAFLGTEIVKDESSIHDVRSSYTLNSDKKPIAADFYIGKDPDGNVYKRIWSVWPGTTYLDVRRGSGQLYARMYFEGRYVDNYVEAWRELTLFNENESPIFSIYASGPKADKCNLRWLFQSRPLDDGSTIVWKKAADPDEKIDMVIGRYDSNGICRWEKIIPKQKSKRLSFLSLPEIRLYTENGVPLYSWHGGSDAPHVKLWRNFTEQEFRLKENEEAAPRAWEEVESEIADKAKASFSEYKDIIAFITAKAPAQEIKPLWQLRSIRELRLWLNSRHYVPYKEISKTVAKYLFGITAILAVITFIRGRGEATRRWARRRSAGSSGDSPPPGIDEYAGPIDALLSSLGSDDFDAKKIEELRRQFVLDLEEGTAFRRARGESGELLVEYKEPNGFYSRMNLNKYVLLQVIRKHLDELAYNSALTEFILRKALVMLEAGRVGEIMTMVGAYRNLFYLISYNQYWAMKAGLRKMDAFRLETQACFIDMINNGSLPQDFTFTIPQDISDKVREQSGYDIGTSFSMDDWGKIGDITRVCYDKFNPSPDASAGDTSGPKNRTKDRLLRAISTQGADVVRRDYFSLGNRFKRLLGTLTSFTKPGPSAIKGLFFWATVGFVWFAWNVFLIKIWTAGAMPYLGALLANLAVGNIAGAAVCAFLLVAALMPILYFGILSIYPIGWTGQGIVEISNVMFFSKAYRIKGDHQLASTGSFLSRANRRAPERLEEIRETYNRLTRNLYAQHKLPSLEERLLADDESISEINGKNLHRIGNRVAKQRYKSWANAYLRSKIIDPMPDAPQWDNLRSLSAIMVSDDPLGPQFSEIIKVHDATHSSLLYQISISRYRDEYEEMARRLHESGDITDAQRDVLINLRPTEAHEAELAAFSLRPQVLMEEFVNDRTQTPWKTCNGAMLIRDAYARYARRSFPSASDPEIEQLVRDRFQYMIIGEPDMVRDDVEEWARAIAERLRANGDPAAAAQIESLLPADLGGIHVDYITTILRQMWACVESSSADAELREELELEFVRSIRAGFVGYLVRNDIYFTEVARELLVVHAIQSGQGSTKATVLGQAVVNATGSTYLLFDADTEIREEDADKILNALGEFEANPKCGIVVFRQYIYNEEYDLATSKSADPINAWWGATLSAKWKVGSVGFYGHNALIDAENMKACLAIEPDFVSEDLKSATAMRREDADVIYRDYLQLGEGIETSLDQYRVPTSKWSGGAVEYKGGFGHTSYWGSPNIPIAEKVDTSFGLGFYTIIHRFIMAAFFWHVISSLVIGINSFGILSPIFGVIGVSLSVAVNILMLIQLWKDYGARLGPVSPFIKWLTILVPFGFLYWTALIASQSQGNVKGRNESVAFIRSQKGASIDEIGSDEDIYQAWKTGIRFASIMLPAVIVGQIVISVVSAVVPLYLILASILYIGALLSMLISPYLFNYSTYRGSDKGARISRGISYGLVRAWQDLAANFITIFSFGIVKVGDKRTRALLKEEAVGWARQAVASGDIEDYLTGNFKFSSIAFKEGDTVLGIIDKLAKDTYHIPDPDHKAIGRAMMSVIEGAEGGIKASGSGWEDVQDRYQEAGFERDALTASKDGIAARLVSLKDIVSPPGDEALALIKAVSFRCGIDDIEEHLTGQQAFSTFMDWLIAAVENNTPATLLQTIYDDEWAKTKALSDFDAESIENNRALFDFTGDKIQPKRADVWTLDIGLPYPQNVLRNLQAHMDQIRAMVPEEEKLYLQSLDSLHATCFRVRVSFEEPDAPALTPSERRQAEKVMREVLSRVNPFRLTIKGISITPTGAVIAQAFVDTDEYYRIVEELGEKIPFASKKQSIILNISLGRFLERLGPQKFSELIEGVEAMRTKTMGAFMVEDLKFVNEIRISKTEVGQKHSIPLNVSPETFRKGFIVSIGGLSRAGKTTAARETAKRLGGIYISRGDIYRAIIWKAHRLSIPLGDKDAIMALLEDTEILIEGERVLVDGVNAKEELYTSEIEADVSQLWRQDEEIEMALFDKAKSTVAALAQLGPVVVTGRGKYPDANVSIFMTAPLRERSLRTAAERSLSLSEENLSRLDDEIVARDESDLAEGMEADVIELENLHIEDTVETILTIIEEKLDSFIGAYIANKSPPIEGYDLSPQYEVTLPLRMRSTEDIIQLLSRHTDRMLADIDMSTPTGKMESYLLVQRYHNFIHEMTNKLDNSLYRALIGICGVAPYAAAQVTIDDGINVFMARDAGRDYTARSILDRLAGREPNSAMFHLSRKNMGNYPAIKKIVERVMSSEGVNRDNFGERFLEEYKEALISDERLRRSARKTYEEIREAGILRDGVSKIRVIDSWSSGNILYYFKGVVDFFSRYEMDDAGNITERAQPRDLEVEVFAISSKDYVLPVSKMAKPRLSKTEIAKWWSGDGALSGRELAKADATLKTVDWRESTLGTEDIKRWYGRLHLHAPPVYNERDLINFAEVMGAQIYTPHNPFGALNLGHPVDWNRDLGELCEASPAKKLGCVLRDALLINSTLDYALNRGLIDSLPDEPEQETEISPVTISVDANGFLREFGIILNPVERALFDSVTSAHSEHFATSNDNIQLQMLLNLAYMIKFLGAELVAETLERRIYEFQAFLHTIKSINPVRFRVILEDLKGKWAAGALTGHEACRAQFRENPLRMSYQIDKYNEEQASLRHPKRALMLDIDGAILEIGGEEVSEEILVLLIALLRTGVPIAINTGRPSAGIRKILLEPMRRMVGNDAEFKRLEADIYLYPTNSVEGKMADGTVLYEKRAFTPEVRGKLQTAIEGLELKPMEGAERPHRLQLEATRDRGVSETAKDRFIEHLRIRGVTGLGISVQRRPDGNGYMIDITSCRKETGWQDFKDRLNQRWSTEIEDMDIFILADEPFAADYELLSRKGAFAVLAELAPSEAEALLRQSTFVIPEGGKFSSGGTESMHSGIVMRKTDDRPPVAVAQGFLNEVVPVLDNMHSGYGNRFRSVYERVLARFPELGSAGIIIQLISGNRNLMDIIGSRLMIDIDLFEEYGTKFEFEELLELDLEEHFHHLALRKRLQRMPTAQEWAIEEAGTDHAKIRRFLEYGPGEKVEVLKALMGDNDIDAYQFFFTLVHSMTKDELRDVMHSIVKQGAQIPRGTMENICNILEHAGTIAPEGPHSNYAIFKLAIAYARQANVYQPQIREYLASVSDEEIILRLLNYRPGLYIDMLEHIMDNAILSHEELMPIVESSILAIEGEDTQLALLFALPAEILSENLASIKAGKMPSPEEREAKLKECVQEAEAFFGQCIKGEVPSWGTIVITSMQEMTPMYEAYLKRLEGVLYPAGTTLIVVDETHLDIDFNCGNGGATGSVLKYLKENYGPEIFDEPVLMLHAGGFGQRMPESIAEGTKALSAVPRLLPNGEVSTNLAEAIRNTYIMAERIRAVGGGVYITNCDGFLVYDRDRLNLNTGGINIITAPIDIDRVAGNLGAVHDKDGVVDIFLEKKPRSQCVEGFLDYPEYLKTGYVPANTANYFFPKGQTIDAAILMWDLLRSYRQSIDTSGEMLTPLATSLNEDTYVAIAGKGEFSRRAYNLAQRLGRAYNLYLGLYGMYEDTGETEIYLHSVESQLGRVFGWQPQLNVLKEDSAVMEGCGLDVSLSGKSRVGANSLVVKAALHDSFVGRNSLLYHGVEAPISGLNMGDDQSLFTVGIKGGKVVAVWRLTKDSPKNNTVWGMTVEEMCKKAGTYAELEEVALAAEKHIHDIPLWDAPLWPILDPGDNIQEALSWMATGDEPSALYTRVSKKSINWLRTQYDYEARVASIQAVPPAPAVFTDAELPPLDELGTARPRETEMLIFMADDDKALPLACSELCQRKGVDFKHFESNDALLEELTRGRRPAVVILDIAISGVPTAELCGTIRMMSPGTKIIVSSGFDEDHELVAACQPRDAFLHKTFQMRSLENILDALAFEAEPPLSETAEIRRRAEETVAGVKATLAEIEPDVPASLITQVLSEHIHSAPKVQDEGVRVRRLAEQIILIHRLINIPRFENDRIVAVHNPYESPAIETAKGAYDITELMVMVENASDAAVREGITAGSFGGNIAPEGVWVHNIDTSAEGTSLQVLVIEIESGADGAGRFESLSPIIETYLQQGARVYKKNVDAGGNISLVECGIPSSAGPAEREEGGKTSSSGNLDTTFTDIDTLIRANLMSELDAARTGGDRPKVEVLEHSLLAANAAGMLLEREQELALLAETAPQAAAIPQQSRGTIAINDASLSSEVRALYANGSEACKQLEIVLGANVRLLGQLSEAEKAGNLVIISEEELPGVYASVPGRLGYLIVPNMSANNTLIAPLVCTARALLSSIVSQVDTKTIAAALNANGFYKKLFGVDADAGLIANFMKTGLFELPTPTYNYEAAEQEQRLSLAAAIAA
ncbi:MAG: (d)CMP kinase, partial [Candidatus Omnitrophica bacterium]|nr:(d)CMP kinase [Candidatus Omnitrophota bacterium]